MSEREIRGLLRTICEELERRGRTLVRKGVRKVLLPTTLGAGLALAGCGDDTTPDRDAKATADAGMPDTGKTDTFKPKIDFGPPMPYMAPDAEPLYDSFGRTA